MKGGKREGLLPAVDLAVDTVPAVRHLAHELKVLGQLQLTLGAGVALKAVESGTVAQLCLQLPHRAGLHLQLRSHELWIRERDRERRTA